MLSTIHFRIVIVIEYNSTLTLLTLLDCNVLVKLESVNRRFGQHLVSSEYRINAPLDPRFKLQWCARSETTTITDQLIDLSPETSTDDPASEIIRQLTRLLLLAFMDATPSRPDSTSEVASYLTEPVSNRF